MSGPGGPRGPLTLGTAGHVDHGKSALVRALTGIDPDRLPEERSRGLSIELGYAALELPGGVWLSVVDVPGHERFVRTMVSGASGIDLFLMVIAADDGVMPQTLEHAEVLAALEVDTGVVAITKSDLVDPALALEQAAELMPGIPAVACASPTGAGVEELRATIAAVAAELPGRAGAGAGGGAGTPGAGAVLHVDRAFTIRGAGTVVTGTLWSGTIRPGDALTLLPADEPVRVRGVQVHDRAVDAAAAGQRVAVNLAGVRVGRVSRGDALVGPGAPVRAATILDARLTLRDAAHNQRVQVHHGTRDVAGRLADLGDGFWQLRLSEPVLAAAGDRLVVRSIAPPDTLGGGVVVDPGARRHGRAAAHRERLAADAADAGPASQAADVSDFATRGGKIAQPAGTDGTAGRGGPAGGAPEPPPAPEPEPLDPAALALADRLRNAGHEPPSSAELGPDDAAHLPALLDAGLAVRVGRDRWAHPEAITAVAERVAELAARDDGVTLAALRDDLGTSRKFAQALLEHLDNTRVTLRLPDDRRVLRGRRG